MTTEEFKKMSFNKKAEHLWEYYKAPFFFGLFIIIVTGWLIYDVFINPSPKPYAWAAIYDNYINSDVIERLSSEYTEKFVTEGENLDVRFTSYYSSEEDPTVAVDMDQKFSMILYARELDIIITGKNEKTGFDYFSNFAKDGNIMPLDLVYSKEELDGFEKAGLLLYCEDTEGKKRPFGVSAKNTESVLKDYKGFNQDTKYIGIAAMSQRIENAKKVIAEFSGWGAK